MRLSILKIESHIRDAKLVRTRMSVTEEEYIEMELFHLIKAYQAIEGAVREIDPSRFGEHLTKVLRKPELDEERLNLCTICGNTRCSLDHK